MGSRFNLIATAAIAAVASFAVLMIAAVLNVAVLVPAHAQPAPEPPPAQPAPPSAQPETTPDSDHRRFVFHRVDGGFLRLDLITGAVAGCRPNGAEWTCVPGRDERAAFEREIARLQRDNAILKNALLERGLPLPAGMAPPPPSAGTGGWWSGDETIPRPPQTVPPTPAPGAPTATPAPGTPAQGAPSDSEFDRVIDAMERGWRRLVEMMTSLKREWEK
jgi:hypothetical protein